jgi:hypothetical protein
MERHLQSYSLWILCVDDPVHEMLTKLALPNVKLLRLSELETDGLKQVKANRKKGEYCWTLTPFTPHFVFEADREAHRATYLDADLWFRKDPAVIFREFDSSHKDVLITDHAYAPEHDRSATTGQYCVQFVTFTRRGGEAVRKRWEEQCLEWCFDRIEDGRFGDQKYLDVWPEQYAQYVHVLSNQELILAPWNATRFPYGQSVAWHFHGLRILKRDHGTFAVDFGHYPLPKTTRINIYESYVKDLRRAVALVYSAGGTVTAQANYSAWYRVKSILSGIYQQIWRLGSRRTTRL